MSTQKERSVHLWQSRDEELRRLNQLYAAKSNAWVAQKRRADELKKQLDKKQRKIKELSKLLNKIETRN